MSNKTGGPAFPLKEPLTCDNEGLSLRDYFAAKAMQSLVSIIDGDGWMDNCAECAYRVADAMLKERGK